MPRVFFCSIGADERYQEGNSNYIEHYSEGDICEETRSEEAIIRWRILDRQLRCKHGGLRWQ